MIALASMLAPLLLALAPTTTSSLVCTEAGDPCARGESSCEVKRAYWHNDCRRHATAADAFAELYTRDPRPAFLYNAANAERLAGDCWTALALYQRFLDLGPPAEEAALAGQNVARCREQIAAGRRRAATIPPRPPVDDDTSALRKPPPRAKHWTLDPAAASLVGVGAGLLAVGAGILGGAASHGARADDARTDASFGDHERRRSTLVNVGIPIAATGGALVIAGVVRWAVLARAERKQRTRRR